METEHPEHHAWPTGAVAPGPDRGHEQTKVGGQVLWPVALGESCHLPVLLVLRHGKRPITGGNHEHHWPLGDLVKDIFNLLIQVDDLLSAARTENAGRKPS